MKPRYERNFFLINNYYVLACTFIIFRCIYKDDISII